MRYGIHTKAHDELATVQQRIAVLDAQWNDPDALQHRLMELFQAKPSAEASKRLLDWVAIYSRLNDMPAQELVEIALDHLSENVTSLHYEQIIEELCTRVWPGWCAADTEGKQL